MPDLSAYVPRLNSSATTFVIAAGLATAIAVWAPEYTTRSGLKTGGSSAQATETATTADKTAGAGPAAAPARPVWAASANGRVEPRNGEVRLAAQTAGRIEMVLVRINDAVREGDLLLRLDDSDALPKIAAARAEAEARRRDRDTEQVPRAAADRRAAEDAVSAAERTLFQARNDLLRIQVEIVQKGQSVASVDAARFAVSAASAKLEAERANLTRLLAQLGLPLPTRLDSALATARAELSAAEVALERTRLKAPTDGTVLQVLTRAGETVAPNTEAPLIVFGDLSALRVRAEVEERDIGKIREGQRVIARSDAMPGRDYEGRVERVAQALGAPRLAARGPRRPNDMDVLEVLIELDGRPDLLPGMRVDVFFKPDATVQRDTPARVN